MSEQLQPFSKRDVAWCKKLKPRQNFQTAQKFYSKGCKAPELWCCAPVVVKKYSWHHRRWGRIAQIWGSLFRDIIIIQIFQYLSPPESDEALLSKSHRMIALISYYVNSRLLICMFFFLLLFHLLLLNHYQCHVHNKRMLRGWVEDIAGFGYHIKSMIVTLEML